VPPTTQRKKPAARSRPPIATESRPGKSDPAEKMASLGQLTAGSRMRSRTRSTSSTTSPRCRWIC
jgi:hypothetical protein